MMQGVSASGATFTAHRWILTRVEVCCLLWRNASLTGHESKRSPPNRSESPFAGASAEYYGARGGGLAKQRGDERKKSHSRCHARLSGRDNPLKALGSVAFCLANGLF